MNLEGKKLLQVQENYKRFRSEARSKYRAMIISGFSQSIEPVRSFCALYKETDGGICQALVNKWIVAHAHEGSLWNDLYMTAGGQQLIKIDKMKELLNEFREGLDNGSKSMGPYQKLNTEVFLMRQGVIPRMAAVSGHRMYGEGAVMSGGDYGVDPLLGQKIVDALPQFVTYGRGAGSYAMISVKSAKGGHVMVAYLGGAAGGSGALPCSDVAFFDPNLGEFWFEKGDDFAKFLKMVVGRVYDDFGGFQIRNFASRVN